MKYLRFFPYSIVMIIILLAGLSRPVQVQAAGTVGDGTPASCTETAFDIALLGGGSVIFNCGPGPVTIPITGEKSITANTTIDGGTLITLDGGGTTRLFMVYGGVRFELKNITLTRGSAAQGGAINNSGDLLIEHSSLTGNLAPGGLGGAIINYGSLSITFSYISNNSASAGIGGGIYNQGNLFISSSILSGNFGGLAGGALENTSTGTASIRNSSFTGNSGYHGGGIVNSGEMTIRNSSFYTNDTNSGFGGGIYNDGNITISQAAFNENSAGVGQKGGGVYNGGIAEINTSTFFYNSAPTGFGGGIYNNGQLAIEADSFSLNSAEAGQGGAIYSATTEPLPITNSTFSENNGGSSGGGLVSAGPTLLLNDTFYNNVPYALVTSGSGSIVVNNTIVAGSPTANCAGTIISEGNNLDDGQTCGFMAPGDIQNINPQLGMLADNGGPTRTHALLYGSPAINAGNNVGCPSSDQRGVRRPLLGTCDIGAYEFGYVINLPLVRK